CRHASSSSNAIGVADQSKNSKRDRCANRSDATRARRRGNRVKRREFIAGLGGAAGWPVVARARQSAMPVRGYLGRLSPAERSTVEGFGRGLKESGYVEGRNAVI